MNRLFLESTIEKGKIGDLPLEHVANNRRMYFSFLNREWVWCDLVCDVVCVVVLL